MPTLLYPGHWYRSKQALARLGELQLVDEPHLTPDGHAVLVMDPGDTGRGRPTVEVDGKVIPSEVVPPCLVPQADHGDDVQHVAREDGRPVIRRVEIPIDALGDLEPLVEYDHLPEKRKDYNAYPRGHRLA